MASKSEVIWTIKELVECLHARQRNKFDANIGVSGKRGNGKSTLLFEIFNSFKKFGFKQEKHQVYKRDDILDLLTTQKFSFCWDDEAINSGYKRDWQNKGQQELIKVVTNFRDNFNIYGSALPFFYSLDKDLRELIFIHMHIIERGLAVILMPLEDQIHSSDQWDTAYNKKIEEQENKRMQRNPNLKFRYHRFSTFAGYLYFHDMTPKQRERYEQIKSQKRAESFNLEGRKQEQKLDFNERLFKLLKEGKLSQEGLQQACLLEDKKYSSTMDWINKRLKDEGEVKTLKHFLRTPKQGPGHNKSKGEIEDLIPDFTT